MPDALHFLVLTVAGWVNRPQDDQLAYLPRRTSGPPGLLAWRLGRARHVPVFGRVGPAPSSPRVPRSLASPCGWAWTQPAAHRQAVSGPRRLARGRTARPYAMVRRTRRRGRRSARGGGAGRVGPPTGWYRLRLLREIGDELVPGVEQFLLINNVVTVEDGAALVPGQEHGDAFGDVRADQVAGGGAAAIVEEAGRHPGRLAGGAPRRAPTADGDPIAVEDERAGGVAACPPPRQGLGNGV